MAVPSSGELELYGDIGTELGVAQSNVTLHGMSQTAGFTPPDAMSEFYGYDPTPPVPTSFNTVLWTGDGSTGRQITGVGFQPDLVWTKGRNSSDWHHFLQDSVRGATKFLKSNTTDAEGTTSPNIVQSFDTDGFTVNANGNSNNSGSTYVAWCFKAGGAAVTNNNGTITSQVSANVEAGFSIVSYTGTGSAATVGHGLNATPKMIIVKGRTFSDHWVVYSDSIGLNGTLLFNSYNNIVALSNYWGTANPTSNVFSLSTYAQNNTSSANFIAYCFAEVAGLSKFGNYSGGTANNLITLGFEPAFVMIKSYSGVQENWAIYDNKRSPSNPVNDILVVNESFAESVNNTNQVLNFNANGFTLVTTNSLTNLSGTSYLYMAFA